MRTCEVCARRTSLKKRCSACAEITVNKPKAFRLGEQWVCRCGRRHTLDGAYLAAHWDIKTIFTCDVCDRLYRVKRGVIFPTRKKRFLMTT